MGEELSDASHVLGMYRVVGPPPLELLPRPAEVLEDRAIDELELTFGRKGRDQPGNAVHDQAQFAFALAQRVLGALLIVDVRQQDAPAHDLSLGIAQRKAAIPEPAKDTIPAPKALLD